MTNNAVKFIVGAFFTLLGILLTLSNLEFGDAHIYLRYWPLVLIAIGAVKIAEPGGRILGAILLVVGASLLANNVEWLRFTIFDLWPVVLIVAGILVVSNALGLRPAPSLGSGSSSSILAVLSQRRVEVREGERRVIAFMGGAEIDLPEPQRDRAPVVIEALAVWGGVELRVPDGWEVQGEVLPVMGGFEANTRSSAQPLQKVIVRGLALMGAVVVKRRLA
jgi:hypothetical protein